MGTPRDKQETRNRVSRSICFAVVFMLAVTSCASSTNSSDTTGKTEQTNDLTSQPYATSSSEGEATITGGGAYISLAEYQASKDSYAESKVVLFFNATWCSTCKKARSNIEADLTAIPADLAIVLVDFDSETTLKRKYGITVQHTFVQIDADGNELAKWSGSLTAQEIVENTV